MLCGSENMSHSQYPNESQRPWTQTWQSPRACGCFGAEGGREYGGWNKFL